MTIKNVINNEGSDGVMPKKYRAYIMSNLHIWRTVAFGSPPETGGKLTQSKSKPERISKPMRLALQLLDKKILRREPRAFQSRKYTNSFGRGERGKLHLQ